MTDKTEKNLIAISVTEENLNSKLEECFGKSHFFLLIDSKSKKYRFVKNPGVEFSKFSGKKAALFLVRNGVKTIVSSNFGAFVKKIFDKNKVQMVIISSRIKYLNDIKWIK
jgi:predicted Fe-Mo cluster-binding NifX family protein